VVQLIKLKFEFSMVPTVLFSPTVSVEELEKARNVERRKKNSLDCPDTHKCYRRPQAWSGLEAHWRLLVLRAALMIVIPM
jgi:hypothetical protein